jgi:hypothetical protein
VRALSIELGEHRYAIGRTNGGATASRARSSGIVLKNEELPLDEWIDELSRDLAESAEQSERGRLALERLLHE